MSYDKLFERLIGHEGGFSDDRRDPGNWTGGRVNVGVLKGTKFGIAANTYPDLDIKNLTLGEAKAIYKRDFWDRVSGDKLPEAFVFQVFDAAVNHGIGNAVRWMQRAAGVADDGKIGPVTLAAIKKVDTADLVLVFNAVRLEFYTALSTWPTFGKGWTRRVAGNLRYAAGDN